MTTKQHSILSLVPLFTALSLGGCSNDTPSLGNVCHVDVTLGQSRYSIDPFNHLKDFINETTFALPTSCEKMKTLKEGDDLVKKFRTGSLLTSGSLSGWDIEIKSVPSIEKPEDPSSCRLRLELRQSRYSFDPLAYAKDALNAVEFDWDVPCTVHDAVAVGQNLLNSDLRVGSVLIKQSISSWKLNVVEKKGTTQPKAAP
ncbi:MAG: hypothetical protein H6868_05180 [Rhodospirillales bacterium]|nr:hypothetical protein [Rhodospirillales bacterium]